MCSLSETPEASSSFEKCGLGVLGSLFKHLLEDKRKTLTLQMWVLQEVHDLSRRAASVVQNWSSIARRRLRSHKTDCQHKKKLNHWIDICGSSGLLAIMDIERRPKVPTMFNSSRAEGAQCHIVILSGTAKEWINSLATCSTTNLAVITEPVPRD